jgi:hypothetical protein
LEAGTSQRAAVFGGVLKFARKAFNREVRKGFAKFAKKSKIEMRLSPR